MLRNGSIVVGGGGVWEDRWRRFWGATQFSAFPDQLTFLPGVSVHICFGSFCSGSCLKSFGSCPGLLLQHRKGPRQLFRISCWDLTSFRNGPCLDWRGFANHVSCAKADPHGGSRMFHNRRICRVITSHLSSCSSLQINESNDCLKRNDKACPRVKLGQTAPPLTKPAQRSDGATTAALDQDELRQRALLRTE